MEKPPWKNFLPCAAFYALILSVSALPATRIQKIDSFVHLPNDKVMHLGIYTVFGFLLGALPYPSVALGMTGSLLGALDEQSQRLAPGREVSFRDWIADVLGISLGLALRRRHR
jgi:VanZ family protein